MAITPNAVNESLREAIELTKDGKSIKAPTCITPNVSSARNVYLSYRTEHLKRISLYAQMEGLFQGNPPYSPSELKNAGLQHISNFNDMSARAVIKRSAQAYWNLLHNSQYLINFRLRLPNIPDAALWGDTMSRNWDFVVKTRWKGFVTNVASLTHQLVKFGVSPTIFPDEESFRWKVVELNKFFIPSNSSTDLDLLTNFAIESEFTLQYLWEVYDSEKDKSKDDSPWNMEALKSFLLRYSRSIVGSKDSLPDMMALEQKILMGDPTLASHFTDVVPLISFYQKEYDGKFSHYMFSANNYGTPEENSSNDEGFLFKLESQYASIYEVLVLFTINPGELRIYANKGVGHETYSLAQAGIMLGCSVVDMAKWASTPIIKSSGVGTKEVGQIKFYPGVPTDIGSADFVQNNLGANVQNVVSVSDYIRKQIQYNLTFSGTDPASPDPSQGSLAPSQLKLMAFNEFSVLKNSIMHFYSVFDILLQNMVEKMLRCKKSSPDYKVCQEWKERCIEEGVPEEIFDIPSDLKEGLPKHIEVVATRAAGAGSQVAHLMGLQEMQSIAGSFGPKAETLFLKQFITAAVGPEHVDGYLQDRDSQDEISGGASVAGLENNVMEEGKMPTFSKDNEHRSHLAVHMQLGVKLIQASQQQQIDPVQAAMIFEPLIPHMTQHMEVLANNPMAQSFVGRVKQDFDQIVQYANLIKKNAVKMQQARIKKQQEDAQKQQQVMAEEELKQMQVMNEEKRKDFKLIKQNQRQDEQHNFKKQALTDKTESDIELNKRKADAQVDTAYRKVDADKEIKTQEINSNAEIERIKAGLDARVKDAESNPSSFLTELNGSTPAPADYE